MKKIKTIILSGLIVLIISCSAQKNKKQVINDFVKEQLNKKEYVAFINKPNILIREAGNGINALLFYEKCYSNFSQINYKYQNWIIDSLEIKRVKSQYQKKKSYDWKITDFVSNKFIIIDAETNEKNYKSENYLNYPDEFLIFTISSPVFIDNKNVLIWFQARNQYGSTFDIFSVLMEKINTKWLIKSYYHDVDNIW